MADLLDNSEINRKREEIQKKRRERDHSDLVKVLSTKEGRRFVWRVLSEAKVFTGTFAGNPHLTSFNEGKRDIGLFIFRDIMRVYPEAFTQMQREASTDKLVTQQEIKNLTENAD